MSDSTPAQPSGSVTAAEGGSGSVYSGAGGAGAGAGSSGAAGSGASKPTRRAMHKHCPYEKMAESTAAWPKRLPACQWIVTEKVHGANLCFVCDGHRVRVAKRRGFIGKDDAFFGFRAAAKSVEPQVMKLHAALLERYPTVSTVWVYGELFGGSYPHPRVDAVEGVHPIQTGVHYSPKLHFMAFDVAWSPAEHLEKVYLDFDEAQSLLRQVGVMTTEPLATCSFQKAMEMSVDFQSTLPARLGLPALDHDNQAEGLVVRAAKESLFRGAAATGFRPLVKRKAAAFAETKYHEGTKASAGSLGFGGGGGATPFRILDSAWAAFLTEARLDAAISKVGPPAKTTPAVNREVLDTFVDDIISCLSGDVHGYNEYWEGLLTDEQRTVRKHVRAEARKLVARRARR